MTGIVETSVLKILASNHYFPVVYFSCFSSSFFFPSPSPSSHHDNAEFISESWLCQYGKPKYIYWRDNAKLQAGMQSSHQTSVPCEIIWSCRDDLKNMVWLLTAEFNKCLALLVFYSISSKWCDKYSACTKQDFIYNLKLCLSQLQWTSLGYKCDPVQPELLLNSVIHRQECVYKKSKYSLFIKYLLRSAETLVQWKLSTIC